MRNAPKTKSYYNQKLVLNRTTNAVATIIAVTKGRYHYTSARAPSRFHNLNSRSGRMLPAFMYLSSWKTWFRTSKYLRAARRTNVWAF